MRCPNFNASQKTCELCGCYMPVKAMFSGVECDGEIEEENAVTGWEGIDE